MAEPETQNEVPKGKIQGCVQHPQHVQGILYTCYDMLWLLLVLNHPFWAVAILTNLTQLRTDCLFTPLPTLQWWCWTLSLSRSVGNLWSTTAKTPTHAGNFFLACGALVARLGGADVQWKLCSSTAVGKHHQHHVHNGHRRMFLYLLAVFSHPDLRSYLLAVFSHPGLP